MTKGKERGRFIEIMRQEGLGEGPSRLLLRYAATLQRLAEAECNGDWPCDNGERKTEPCARCQSGYVRSAMKKTRDGLVCQDCRTEDRVRALLERHEGFSPYFQGDPRGAVLKVQVPSGRDASWDGVAVPS